MAKIQSGKADCVAVVAADTTKVNARVVSSISQEPLFHRPFGESNVTLHARLANECDVTEEDLARVAAKNYAGAAETSWAHRREGHSLESVLDSERVSNPLQKLMTAPGGDTPVNPSGGVLTTNSGICASLSRHTEVVLQFMSEAEDRQISDAQTGFSHSWGANLGQFHQVDTSTRPSSPPNRNTAPNIPI